MAAINIKCAEVKTSVQSQNICLNSELNGFDYVCCLCIFHIRSYFSMLFIFICRFLKFFCTFNESMSNALNSWKLNIYQILQISFYLNNLDLLPDKPKLYFCHLKQCIQEFHRKYAMIPADKAAK